jgi:hypothetical protein
VIDLTTFPAPSGFADLRPRTSSNFTGNLSGGGTVTINGTTLEQPPSQPNGGGFNSSMGVGAVTLGTPLANGASINVHILNGIQQTGTVKIGIMAEAVGTGVTHGNGGPYWIQGATDAPTAAAVGVSGRVFATNGAGLRNATVYLIDSNGGTRTVTTGAFGYFNFDGVELGNYVVRVRSKSYTFAPRPVSIQDQIADLDLYPQ